MTVRERIWNTLDDPELARHTALRDALYQLLVAIEFGRPPGPTIEQCLDLTAEAIRHGSVHHVTRAHAVIDALVANLAACASPDVAAPYSATG